MKNIILNAIFATCGFIVSAQPTFVSTTPSNKNVIIEQFTYEDMGTPEADNLINRFLTITCKIQKNSVSLQK